MKTTLFANKGLATVAMNRANKTAGFEKYGMKMSPAMPGMPATFDLFLKVTKAPRAEKTTVVDFKVVKETPAYFLIEGAPRDVWVEKKSLIEYAVNAFNILSATVTAKYAKAKLAAIGA